MTHGTTVVGVDLETTGLDTVEGRITELGMVVAEWDSILCEFRLLSAYSSLVYDEAFDYSAYMTDKALMEKIGITYAMIENQGRPPREVLLELVKEVSHADYVVMHNGYAFDAPFIAAELKRNALTPIVYSHEVSSEEDNSSTVTLIDTCMDIDFPCRTRQLNYLAAEYGIINPFAHRALPDTLTMMQVLQAWVQSFKCSEDREYQLELLSMQTLSPVVLAQANVSYEDRQLAKAAKFKWHADSKRWLMRARERKVDMLENPGFTVTIREDDPTVNLYD